MDIFEEIKEAVMQATPGEDTRNYYRNQGVAMERERIIKLLEGYAKNIADDRIYGIEVINLQSAIELIKGETNA